MYSKSKESIRVSRLETAERALLPLPLAICHEQDISKALRAMKLNTFAVVGVERIAYSKTPKAHQLMNGSLQLVSGYFIDGFTPS